MLKDASEYCRRAAQSKKIEIIELLEKYTEEK
jgi:hypothetical protein